MPRPRWFLLLGVATCGLVGSVVGARLWAGHWTHGFLLWNLGLALIPLAIGLLAVRVGERRGGALTLVPLLFLWLLFLPNSPYLVTDLVHLRWGGDALPWLVDALILSLAGTTGLLAGVLSLAVVREIVRGHFGARASQLVLVLVIPLISVGVYLGRVVRLNSWDAILEPWSVASTVLAGLRDPLEHERALVFVILFAAFLAAAFVFYERLNAARFPLQRRNKSHGSPR
jgi:uncharacterized membrane protein